MSEKTEGAGDSKETTAVTRAPERPSNGQAWKIILSLAVGGVMACLAIMAVTCASKPSDKRATVETRVNQIAVDVAMLQGQMGLTTARTSVVEARVDKLRKEAATDRDSVQTLAETVSELAKRVEAKADRDELKKYARNVRRRVEVVEQEVAAIRAKPAPLATTSDDGVGTVTVKVVTVPINPDEE